ncbi:MAG TPA: helix-turn-helix domain-containing protein [Solirubrobacteraceae bacterium]|nr:helix-turn-helix domain-containing protein [Solirubrobacteraceae bacterium]
MERAILKELLGEGLSLAEIGRRLGRHESTVAYWLEKFDLTAANARRHAARGGLSREQLTALVERGMTIAEMALQLERSKATVRYWLTRHGLSTQSTRGRRRSPEAVAARSAGLVVATMACPRHGETAYVLDGRGYYRCRRCRAEAVSRRRRKVKETLVREAGGACAICGYGESMRALHFHHLEPSEKRIEINAKGIALSLETLRTEARKCVLLCSNCHAEVEDGSASIPAVTLERASTTECPPDPG